MTDDAAHAFAFDERERGPASHCCKTARRMQSFRRNRNAMAAIKSGAMYGGRPTPHTPRLKCYNFTIIFGSTARERRSIKLYNIVLRAMPVHTKIKTETL